MLYIYHAYVHQKHTQIYTDIFTHILYRYVRFCIDMYKHTYTDIFIYTHDHLLANKAKRGGGFIL